MTMEMLFNSVQNAISQYERACQQEGMLYEGMRDAEDDMNRYSAQASSAEEPSDQREALERMREAALRYQQYQNQLRQVQAAKQQALAYLQATRAELTNVIVSLEEKLPRLDQSISTFEQMASNPFGSSARAQVPQLRARRAEYQQNLNDAYSLVERIDSVVNGSGDAPALVLRQR